MPSIAQTRVSSGRSLDAVRVTASAFGIYAGMLGIEHGFFETLQGNAVPIGIKILAVSGSGLPFPFGHEPAMTLIPNFLVTGICAILVGLSIVLWSAASLRKKHHAAVLPLLSVLLLLVGGGFGPISLLIAASFGAFMIDHPLTWWKTHLPGSLGRCLAVLWIWSFTSALLWVPGEFILGQIFHLKNDQRQILTNLNLMLSYPMLGLFALTLISAFAHRIENRSE
jgi:hypothetical protein